MAIELCSDDSSPRISFSHDISQTDTLQIPSTNTSSSTIDFDFCVFHQNFDLQSSSADELFFDGKILPIEMKRKIPPSLPQNNNSDKNSETTKSHKLVIPDYNTSFKNEISSTDEKQSSKSFWRFKRSNSSSSYARTLCPLPILSRSNSTGSTPSVKHKQYSQKSSSSVSSSSSSSNGHYQKPPLRKVPGYINGIKISPVLNVPPANLFGFSSIFSSGKEKNKKR